MIEEEFTERIRQFLSGDKLLTFLVGAGISAESGIPTFRGADGFWTVGSQNYTPQQMGTRKMFNVQADEVWRWYLYRIAICQQAQPNAGHYSLVDFEQLFGERFVLISQNVDGLHFRAGNSPQRTLLIHGDLRFMRCSEPCSNYLYPIPDPLLGRKNEPLRFTEKQLLRCPRCWQDCRPHVLWFDEYYDEEYYKLNTALRKTAQTGLLVIVGTSGATNLPQRIVNTVIAHEGLLIDINPNENVFTAQLQEYPDALHIPERSTIALPTLFTLMKTLKHSH